MINLCVRCVKYMTHTIKTCLKRPQKVIAKWIHENIASTVAIIPKIRWNKIHMKLVVSYLFEE